VQGNGASPATNPCDDNPSGYLKGATLTAQFGRTAFDTGTIEFGATGRKLNRGIMTDLRLRGAMLGLSDETLSNMNDQSVVQDLMVASEMVKTGMLLERGTAAQNGMVVQTWQGSPSRNTAGGGFKEFPGLDLQIATGHVDALTNVSVPAADSDVRNFGYNTITANSAELVRQLSSMEYNLYYNARRMGLAPVQWVIAMTPGLWQELTDIWPLTYNTQRGADVLSGNTRMIVDGGDMIALRDQMRQSMSLNVNGRVYPVVTDDGIFEKTSNAYPIPAASYASSIYFIPLTITGGFPATYFEYVDYRNAGVSLPIANMVDFWTDGGLYSWAIETQKWCFKMSVKTERRIVLRVPQLAARLDDIVYSPEKHVRSPFEDNPYYVDGGVSLRSASTLYTPW